MAEPSLASKTIVLGLRLTRLKKRSNREWLKGIGRNPVFVRPPRILSERFDVHAEVTAGYNVWFIEPQEARSEHYVFALHGGAYVQNFLPFHWMFYAKLVDRLGCTIVAPEYPLAPEHQVMEVFGFLGPLYRDFVARVGAQNVTLMGDSAGGGLALALAQQLRETGVAQPANILLLSPWLDVTMSNPAIPSIDRHDPVLFVEGLLECGHSYAGDLPRTHPLVSPIYGDLKGLAPIIVFIGTHDVLSADCRKLKQKADAEGISLEYFEYQGMIHNWMFLPTPDAQDALDKIMDRITSGATPQSG